MGQAALDWARERGDTTIAESDLQLQTKAVAVTRAMDSHLHVHVVSLTAKKPNWWSTYNARKKCGFDAWRIFCRVYEPGSRRAT